MGILKKKQKKDEEDGDDLPRAYEEEDDDDSSVIEKGFGKKGGPKLVKRRSKPETFTVELTETEILDRMEEIQQNEDFQLYVRVIRGKKLAEEFKRFSEVVGD